MIIKTPINKQVNPTAYYYIEYELDNGNIDRYKLPSEEDAEHAIQCISKLTKNFNIEKLPYPLNGISLIFPLMVIYKDKYNNPKYPDMTDDKFVEDNFSSIKRYYNLSSEEVISIIKIINDNTHLLFGTLVAIRVKYIDEAGDIFYCNI